MGSLPEVVVDQQETKRLIAEMLDTLSEEQRVVVAMFYYDEMSVREIAETLDCSEGMVKSRLNYARKKIKARVEEKAFIRQHVSSGLKQYILLL